MVRSVRREAEEAGALIRIRVLPRASRNQIVGMEGGVLKVKLTAPPVEGKANQALRSFLSKRLGLAKTRVEIVSGEKSKLKSVSILGLSAEEIEARLRPCYPKAL